MTQKNQALTLAAVLLLSACTPSALPPEFGIAPSGGTSVQAQTYRLAASHWQDVAKIRAEANRLGTQVRTGKMTRVQAAQHLNRFRIRQVGHNSVDDSVYDVYLQTAVDNQRGAIDAAQSKAYIENALRGWQQRWNVMDNKPANPAFTNFLLEFLGMEPLR